MISDPLYLISDEKLRKYLHRGPWVIEVCLAKTSKPRTVGNAVTGMPANVVKPPLRHQGQHESTVKPKSDSTKRFSFSRKEENLKDRNFTNSMKSMLTNLGHVNLISLRAAGTLTLSSGKRDIGMWPIYTATYRNYSSSVSCEVREFIIYLSSSVDTDVVQLHGLLKQSKYKSLGIVITDMQQFYKFII